jgi:hypothetical protein
VPTMTSQLRALVATGAVVLLVGGCSDTSAPAASGKPSSSPPASAGAGSESAKQRYLDTVNGLCDQLLPKVIRVTHGGTIDVPARQYLHDWPAHRKVLAAFDTSLAAVAVPPSAVPAARAMRTYVRFADRLDAARLRAARQGQQAWHREAVAERNVESSPAIIARTAAGFAPSCDAR